MYALMASGSRRKKRSAKIAKKKLPKRRYKHRLRIKKRKPKKHYRKKYRKQKPKRKRKGRKYYKRKPKKRYRKRTGLSSAERSAKEWISWHESRDEWNASNGICYGRYQLAPAYLHGDYSPANQNRTADRYVHTRYGNWINAKAFWQVHHWY